jgi:hypothetical protein
MIVQFRSGRANHQIENKNTAQPLKAAPRLCFCPESGAELFFFSL